MFKLLPEQTKKKIEKEYRLRRTVVLAFTLSLVLVIFAVGAFPSYLISHSRVEEARAKASASIESATSKDNEVLGMLAEEVRTKISLLSSTNTGKPYESFREAAILAPEGIKIRSFRLEYVERNGTLVLDGIAANRKALLDYQKILQSSGTFTGADLPVSQFAKDKDIEFTLTLTLKRI